MYVDDLVIVFSSSALLVTAVRYFPNELECSDKRSLRWYLGVCMQSTIQRFTQTAFIEQMLDEFNLTDIKAHETPMISSFLDELFHHMDDLSFKDGRYRGFVVSLMLFPIK